MSAAFYLVHHETETLIASPALGIRIRVYDLASEDYQPTPGKMDFYGKSENASFAFETQYSDGYQLESITEALQWYAAYRQCIDMTFSLMDPRKNLPLSV
ncbi:hypothetical protein KHS38_11875 [Mucilaginibacter sp. Bleaf8]|uniref:hypothetical protein n=1 Tax=Mucilaginibacter sp. Bleaf8 TaxID=2834430 RepID=UPI001BD0FB74|nr:hypothetical protein [Mucilaginibacter sp. Bleaf8]MBS7565104.1 hypothetical protein [Mucilaginibacter sp. Bleaf8]